MRHILRMVAFTVAILFCTVTLPAPNEIGVVLLHGKQGTGDDSVIGELSRTLIATGYLVSTPTTAWSRTRIYDATVDEAMLEIDQAIRRLREQGAKKIVVAGQSLGGNVAIRFAATRANIDGIIALAPAHNPDSATARKLFSADLARARKMIADGKGDEKDRFLDANAGTFTVMVTPRVYISWWGESDGALLMPRNAGNIKSPTPFLYVVGSNDSLTRPKEDIFEKAPAHPLSKYVVVEASHLQVPSAARSVVLSWLATLPM